MGKIDWMRLSKNQPPLSTLPPPGPAWRWRPVHAAADPQLSDSLSPLCHWDCLCTKDKSNFLYSAIALFMTWVKTSLHMLVIVGGQTPLAVCGHVVLFGLLWGHLGVPSFCPSCQWPTTICLWLYLNSQQINSWNSQQLIWQDDIMWAGFVSPLCEYGHRIYVYVVFLKNCFTYKQQANICIFLWNKWGFYFERVKLRGIEWSQG